MLAWPDYIVIGIITFSVLVSLLRGFVREALSLASWIAAFWIAFTFNKYLIPYLEPHITSVSARYPIAFLILFVATLIVGSLINYLIGLLVDKTGLTGTDRALGMIFGAGRGVLFVTILLLVAHLTPLPTSAWWRSSTLIPHFEPLEVWLKTLLPDSMNTNFKLVNAD